MIRSWLPALPRRTRDHLLIACFPKSGSTYLSRVLGEITGLSPAYASEVGPQNEQDLSSRKLRRLRRRSILQQHVKGTVTNVELMLEQGIRPMLQTRSLYDVVVSLHDHFESGSRSLSCGYISQDYLRMGWNDRCDYLIHLYLPWYFNFLISWRDAAERIETCSITYEELFTDQAAALARIADFYGIRASDQQIAAAVERATESDTRFNVGRIGRGAGMLNRSHKHAIQKMADLCNLPISETGDAAFSTTAAAFHSDDQSRRLAA